MRVAASASMASQRLCARRANVLCMNLLQWLDQPPKWLVRLFGLTHCVPYVWPRSVSVIQGDTREHSVGKSPDTGHKERRTQRSSEQGGDGWRCMVRHEGASHHARGEARLAVAAPASCLRSPHLLQGAVRLPMCPAGEMSIYRDFRVTKISSALHPQRGQNKGRQQPACVPGEDKRHRRTSSFKSEPPGRTTTVFDYRGHHVDTYVTTPFVSNICSTLRPLPTKKPETSTECMTCVQLSANRAWTAQRSQSKLR
jgi:hypothetical protein